MSRFRSAAALLLAFLAPLSGCTPSTALTAGERDTIEAALAQITQDYAAALNMGDAAAIAALFVEDGVLLDPTQADARGPEQIRQRYAALFDSTSFSGTIITSNGPVVTPAVAFDNGTSTATLRARGDSGTERSWKWMSIVERQADGTWKLKRLMPAPVGATWPAPPPPPARRR